MCEKADSAPIVLSGHGLPESMEGVETPLKAWKSNKTGNMLRVQEVQSSNPGGPINQFRPRGFIAALSPIGLFAVQADRAKNVKESVNSVANRTSG